MPTFYNNSGGNFFFNYAAPLIKGEAVVWSSANIFSWLTGAFGATTASDSGGWVHYRLPASGLEMKTGTVISNGQYLLTANARFTIKPSIGNWAINTSNTVGGTTSILGGTGNVSSNLFDRGSVGFGVVNDFAMCYAEFTTAAVTVLKRFVYAGWLREPGYTGTSLSPRGLIGIQRYDTTLVANRVTSENSTGLTVLSTADNAITNPAITCSISTPGADATDIVIRENVAPNPAIGKLYNCVSLPNAAEVGQIWKNTGVDPETGLTYANSNIDKYLVIMPWGGRKLGMRIWTEGYS